MRTRPRSLRSEILLRLALPLLFFMTIETVLSYFVTLHYVNSAYDRWLQDSGKSLAQEIKVRDGKVVVDLPPAALEMFRWDDQDKTYFKIISSERGVLAGDNLVPDLPATAAANNAVKYFDALMRGDDVRVIAMFIKPTASSENIYLYVAETLNKRRTMMWDILLADLVPQSLLVLFAGIYLLLGVKRGLRPLNRLANEIAQRSSKDLRPIPDTHVISEVRVLINTINDLLGRLSSAIATQQRFIANAAHQLRTPLAGLKLQAERAQREEDIIAMRPALAHIQQSADRMSHLTSQLLVLARAEPITGGYELAPLDLGNLARSQCMQWAPKAWQRKIELSFDSTAEKLPILGDHILLEELLANLLDNAIAYGREQGSIQVALYAQPLTQLVVTDDGMGIPAHESDRIFERFYRIAGSVGNGCGLGLSIVKEIVDLHKATIKFERVSAAGGTRVTITFQAIN